MHRTSTSLEKDIKRLKRRENLKLKTFKTLQYNIRRIFDINSSNGMFCAMHDFISKTLSFNHVTAT